MNNNVTALTNLYKLRTGFMADQHAAMHAGDVETVHHLFVPIRLADVAIDAITDVILGRA
jgi:hypothetical protein